MVCIYSCIKWKGALLVCEKSLTKIVQNWFWILYLWFKKTGGEYKREKKNDGNKSEIMKKNGRYLIEWEYFV